MSDDPYAMVAGGKLKLKNDTSIKKKKKKSKDKDKEKEKAEKSISDGGSITLPKSTTSGRQLTQAELKFKQMQDKMKKKQILEKASMTHKQRVEKFNEHLDSLTEHFDIPKVSWTK